MAGAWTDFGLHKLTADHADYTWSLSATQKHGGVRSGYMTHAATVANPILFTQDSRQLTQGQLDVWLYHTSAVKKFNLIGKYLDSTHFWWISMNDASSNYINVYLGRYNGANEGSLVDDALTHAADGWVMFRWVITVVNSACNHVLYTSTDGVVFTQLLTLASTDEWSRGAFGFGGGLNSAGGHDATADTFYIDDFQIWRA